MTSKLLVIIFFISLANAVIAALVVICFHAIVVFKILDSSPDQDSLWGIGKKDAQSSFARFFAGELFPDLRRKWSIAVIWAVLSIPAAIAMGLALKLKVAG